MDDVYVVELTTTGPSGFPKDDIAEVAVCRMDADGMDFSTVYNDGIALDPRDLGKDALDWLQSGYGMDPEELYAGSPKERVVDRVQGILYGRECSAYNVNNVFGRYLCFEPWDMTGNATLLPSISLRLPPDMKGPAGEEHLQIRRAYDALCPDDPAEVGDGRRAIHMAQMATCVLMVLRRRGLS